MEEGKTAEAGERHRTPANPAGEGPLPLLGILFVHGIGFAKRGETIPWAGEPLYRFMSAWLNGTTGETPDFRIYLSNTRLVRPIPSELDAPAYTQMYFPRTPGKPSKRDPSWVLAESVWDTEFTPPSFGDIVSWGFNVGPWMIEKSGVPLFLRIFRALTTMQQVVKTAIDGSEQFGHKLLYVPWLALAMLIYIVELPILLSLGIILTVVGVLLQLFILALLVLAPNRTLGTLVLSLQTFLAGWLGDAFIIGTSPTRADAMVSQLQRDIWWLRHKKKCKKIAVIAHSGGAPIAYNAVVGGKSYDYKVDLLVTYGSGHSKIVACERLWSSRGFFFAINPLIRIAGAGVFIYAMVNLDSLVKWVDRFIESVSGGAVTIFSSTTILSGGLVLAVVVFALSVAFRSLDRVFALMNVPVFLPEWPHKAPWVDYFAVADPVTDGLILLPDNSGKTRSTMVDNLHSILGDHSGYWANNEQFVSDVASMLCTIIKRPDLVPGTRKKQLDDATAIRHNRVFLYLVTGLLSVLSVPMLLIGLGPWSRDIGEFIRDKIPSWLFGLNELSPFGVGLLGMAVIAIGVALWYQVGVFPAWRLWSRRETQRLYDGKFEINRSDVLLFLVLSLVVPALTCLIMLFRLVITRNLQSSINTILQTLTSTENIPLLATNVLMGFVLFFMGIMLFTSIGVAFLGWLSFKHQFLEVVTSVEAKEEKSERKRSRAHLRSQYGKQLQNLTRQMAPTQQSQDQIKRLEENIRQIDATAN